MGFNDGQSASENGMGINATTTQSCYTCDGAVHPSFYDLQDDLQYYHRFPGGTVANYYHRYLSYSGGNATTFYQQNSPNYIISNSSYLPYLMRNIGPQPTESNNNMIFPFINKLTHNKNGNYSAESNFVLNLMQHYIKYTLNGVEYNPRNEIFTKSNEIASCSTYALLQTSTLSNQFKLIVQENIDAIKTLLDNNVTVKNIELGNELHPKCFSTNVNSNTQQNYDNFINGVGINEKLIWYCEPLANIDIRIYGPRTKFTLDCFANLCKMYVGVINSYFTNNTFKFGIQSGKFGFVPLGGQKWAFVGTNNAWFHYLIFPNKNYIGYDAVIEHPYPGPADSVNINLSNDAYFTAVVPKLDTKLGQEISRTVLDSLSKKLPQNTNIWLTEWNWSNSNYSGTNNSLRINNTMLDVYGKSEFLFSMIDGNTYNVNVKNLYSIANHHYFNSSGWWEVAVNLPYNGNLFKRAPYYVFKLMQPVINNKLGYEYITTPNITNINAGFTNIPNGVKFRSFYKSGGNCNYDVGELLLYYANTSGSYYTINLNNYLSPMLTSNPTYYIPNGLVYNYGTWANKLYASCGASFSTATELGNTDAYYISNPTDSLKNIQIADAYLTNPQVSSFIIKKYSVGYLRIPIRKTVGSISCLSRMAKPNNEQKSVIENKLNIYPNPTKDILVIDLFSNQKSTGTIEIYNMEGKLVESHSIELSEGNNTTQINVSSLPNAFYVVKINYNETSVSKKIEIIK